MILVFFPTVQLQLHNVYSKGISRNTYILVNLYLQTVLNLFELLFYYSIILFNNINNRTLDAHDYSIIISYSIYAVILNDWLVKQSMAPLAMFLRFAVNLQPFPRI